MYGLQLPMPGEGEYPYPVGPAVPPSVDYAVESYIPFLVMTVVIPLAGLLFLWARGLLYAFRGKPLTRPDSMAYSVYIIAGLFTLAGGAAVVHKAVTDHVYGSLIPWRFIRSEYELDIYLGIASFLGKFFLLAGIALGLALLLLLFARSYDHWYADLVVYLGSIAWFLYLTPKPIKRFKYAYNYIQAHNIEPGAVPYSLVDPSFEKCLLLGFILGATVAMLVFIVYSIKRRR